MTCRCPMCGRKNASRKLGLGSYIRAGLKPSETGLCLSRVQASRYRRRRGKQLWRTELSREEGE